MFRIGELIINPEREEHIWTKHHVTRDEAEEVCFSDPVVIRARNGAYAAYGRTEAG